MGIGEGLVLLWSKPQPAVVFWGSVHLPDLMDTKSYKTNVAIEGIAREGDGIARIEGFVIFVPGTKIGDHVTIKIERVLRRFAIAALAEKK